MGFLKHGSIQLCFCSVTLNINNSLISIIISWSIYFFIPISSNSPPPLLSSPVMLAVPEAWARRGLMWLSLSPSNFPASLPLLLVQKRWRRKAILSSPNYGGGIVLTPQLVGGLSAFFVVHDTHSLV